MQKLLGPRVARLIARTGRWSIVEVNFLILPVVVFLEGLAEEYVVTATALTITTSLMLVWSLAQLMVDINAGIFKLIWREFYPWMLVYEASSFCYGYTSTRCWSIRSGFAGANILLMLIWYLSYDGLPIKRRRRVRWLALWQLIVFSGLLLLLFFRRIPSDCHDVRIGLSGQFMPTLARCAEAVQQDSGMPSMSLRELSLNSAGTYLFLNIPLLVSVFKDPTLCVAISAPLAFGHPRVHAFGTETQNDLSVSPPALLEPVQRTIKFSETEQTEKLLHLLVGSYWANRYLERRRRWARVVLWVTGINIMTFYLVGIPFIYLSDDWRLPLSLVIAINTLILLENGVATSNLLLAKRVFRTYEFWLTSAKVMTLILAYCATLCWKHLMPVCCIFTTTSNLLLDTYPAKYQKVLRLLLVFGIALALIVMSALYFHNGFGMYCVNDRLALFTTDATITSPSSSTVSSCRIGAGSAGDPTNQTTGLPTTVWETIRRISFSWTNLGISSGWTKIVLSRNRRCNWADPSSALDTEPLKEWKTSHPLPSTVLLRPATTTEEAQTNCKPFLPSSVKKLPRRSIVLVVAKAAAH